MKGGDWQGLGALFLALAFASIAAQGWPDLGQKGWEAAAAIAAVISSIVALHIAGGERRLREKARAMEALVLLEVVRPELETLLDDLKRALILLESMLQLHEGDYSNSARQLRGVAANMKLGVVRSERNSFPVLPAEKAIAMGRLLGKVPGLATALDGLSQCGYLYLPTVLLVSSLDIDESVRGVTRDINCVLGHIEPTLMSQLTTSSISDLWSARLRQEAAERHESGL